MTKILLEGIAAAVFNQLLNIATYKHAMRRWCHGSMTV